MYGSGKPAPTPAPPVPHDLGVERGERAVGRDAGLDLRARRRPVARREVLFLAVEHQLHGRARLLRELRADDALRVGAELAAEPAAHVLA